MIIINWVLVWLINTQFFAIICATDMVGFVNQYLGGFEVVESKIGLLPDSRHS